MSLRDSRGMPLSTGNPASLERYEKALDLIHSYFVDPLAVLDAAVSEDPEFVMGHAMRAGLIILAGDSSVLPMLRASVEAGEKLHLRANDRERRHLAAARAWLDGDLGGAVRRYGELLHDYPRDSLALQVAHVGDFFLGQSTLLRDRVAQVLPYWDASVPGYGYVLGMHAFGLEETGDYARAEDSGLRALALNPRDPWAIHAVTHVFEMQGRQADGIRLLTQRVADWAPDNSFAIHNWWHLALFHLDLGEIDKVLALYDARIRGREPSKFALDMVDATALLWRLALQGVDVGSRWQELADCWRPTIGDGFYAFNDAHAMMAFVATGRGADIEALLGSLERRARGSGTNAYMAGEVGLPLCRALREFGRGAYAAAAEGLLAIRPIAHRFGGSHAQRDLIHLTALEAAHRAGRHRLAFALASERTQLKPSSPSNWKLAARSARQIGDEPIAAQVGERAVQLARARLQAAREQLAA
jgi:tetratricopeptide (TPR) repeat protein